MTRGKVTNTAASVRNRLMVVAKQRGEDFNYVLTRYGLERLLYRISVSRHANVFTLKGAALFQLWTNQPHRPTRDLDFLGCGDPAPERFENLMRDVCSTLVDDDGLQFDPNSIVAEQIKEDAEYLGIRLRIVARLHTARIPLQLDIGFGDAITPASLQVSYPALLDFPAARIAAYPRETVIAEKYQAMVVLGIANSRMKDFYDIWTLAREFSFAGQDISSAIAATFARRQTPLPATQPLALTDDFAGDARKQTQWKAFLRKGRLADNSLELSTVTELLSRFLMPATAAARQESDFDVTWPAGGPWENQPASSPA